MSATTPDQDRWANSWENLGGHMGNASTEGTESPGQRNLRHPRCERSGNVIGVSRSNVIPPVSNVQISVNQCPASIGVGEYVPSNSTRGSPRVSRSRFHSDRATSPITCITGRESVDEGRVSDRSRPARGDEPHENSRCAARRLWSTATLAGKPDSSRECTNSLASSG